MQDRKTKLPLDGDALRDVLAEWDVTINEFAETIGTTRKTVSEWLAGRTKIPRPVQLLVRIMEIEVDGFQMAQHLSRGYAVTVKR